MKILLAVDGSRITDVLIQEVLSRPWPANTSVHVLYVVNPKTLTSDFVDVESHLESEQRAANALVQEITRTLSTLGIPVTPVTFRGQPQKVIVGYARVLRADLILIGAHSKKGFPNFFLGNVAKEVVHNAPCTVEVIRKARYHGDSQKNGVKILLATDGSRGSMAAAREVAARGRDSVTEVKVVSVMSAAATAAAPLSGVSWIGYDFTPSTVERTSEPAEQVIGESKAVLESAGVPVSEAVLVGKPKEQILTQAADWGADYIVVGSHERNGFERALHSSVSEWVAMNAACSVIVVRDSQDS